MDMQRYQAIQQEQRTAYQTMRRATPGTDERLYWEAVYQARRIEARALERLLKLPSSVTKRCRVVV